MDEMEKQMLSMVYTYGSTPVEACDTVRVEAMEFLKERGLVVFSLHPFGEFGPAYWVTPALKPETLDWERETQRSRISAQIHA